MARVFAMFEERECVMNKISENEPPVKGDNNGQHNGWTKKNGDGKAESQGHPLNEIYKGLDDLLNAGHEPTLVTGQDVDLLLEELKHLHYPPAEVEEYEEVVEGELL